MDDRVPLVHDLRRRRSEPLHALRDPPIPLIDQVVAERPQCQLIPADGRKRLRAIAFADISENQASASAGVHCHGYRSANAANRRTTATRCSIVSVRKNRERC